jgi:hypothetical protein
MSKRTAGYIHLERPIISVGSSSEHPVADRMDKESPGCVGCFICLMVFLIFSGFVIFGAIVAQWMLLSGKLCHHFIGCYNVSWGITLLPTTICLGVGAFWVLVWFIHVNLFPREYYSSKRTDAENQNNLNCCYWTSFGFAAFVFTTFIFLIMLSLFLDGYVDLWVVVVPPVSACILFVSFYRIFCIPNKYWCCTPKIHEASYDL